MNQIASYFPFSAINKFIIVQIGKKSERNLIGLSDKAKSVNYSSYTAKVISGEIKKGKRILKTYSNFFGFDLTNTYFALNRDGEIIEKAEYKDHISTTYKRSYKMILGKKQHESTYYYRSDKKIFYDSLKYDNKGTLTRLETFDTKGHLLLVISLTIDVTEKRIYVRSFSSDGKICLEDTYKYNDQGLVVGLETSIKEENLCDYYNWLYNDIEEPSTKKNITECIQFKHDYRYNSNNIVVETYTECSKDPRKTINCNHQYTYNEQGDWIKKIYISENTPKFVIERNIEYFED